MATLASMFLVAILYSFVGHGGASGYLAVLSLTALAHNVVSSSALALNLVVAGISFLLFAKAKHFSWPLTWPFLLLAVPCSYLGASIKLTSGIYSGILGIVLIFAAVMLFWRAGRTEETCKPPRWAPFLAGAGIGLVSGIVGVGGGIFLSPLILLLRWADAKTTAAASAVFIVANSLAGLAGRGARGDLELAPHFLFIAALCAAGSLVGSSLGAKNAPPAWIRIVLGLVLCTAAAKHLLAWLAAL